MNLCTLPLKRIIYTACVFISVFIVMPSFGMASEDHGIIHIDPNKNVIGVFPDETTAVWIANNVNEGPLADGMNRARVVTNSNSTFSVVVESTQVINAINFGCELKASTPIVRQGKEVVFTWQTDYSALTCNKSEDECGLISNPLFQGEAVDGASVIVKPEATDVYMFSGEVLDIETLEGRPNVVNKPIVCTEEVQVVNFFPWLMWKLFAIRP